MDVQDVGRDLSDDLALVEIEKSEDDFIQKRVKM